MSIDLRAADPAAALAPDPSAPQAQGLLVDILAAPVAAHRRRRRPARIALAGVVAAAAAVGVFVGLGRDSSSGVHLGESAYSVTRDNDGSVHAVIRWSRLDEPRALQRELDRARARTRIFVVRDGARLCQPADTVPYRLGAVDWSPPVDGNTENGLVVHPDEFPLGGTFVLVVVLADRATGGGTTFGPSFPPIASTLSYMQVGPVEPPLC
jgi:hypothetical protein